MDTSEKCTGIVIFHILIHITRNRRETRAVYQIGLVPFASSHAAHTDISFKYRLLAIIEQKSPCLPHGPGPSAAHCRLTKIASITEHK